MLMQLWKPECELNGINSGSRYHYLPIRIYNWLAEGGYTAVVCEVVCYMEVRPGLSGNKTRWHLSEQRWECLDRRVMLTQKNKVPSKELEDRLGMDDIILVLQQNRLRWYGHVLRKEGSRQRGRPKRTRTEVVQKDCQTCKLNREDAMDRSRQKMIKVGWWSRQVSEWMFFFWYRLTWAVPDKRP